MSSKEYLAAWFQKNKKRIYEYRQTPEVKEKLRVYRKKWYAEKRDEVIAKRKMYYKENAERIKIRNGKQQKEYRDNLKLTCFKHYSGSDVPMCSDPTCNVMDIDMLTIDHINGNGGKHRREIKVKTGMYFYRWLKENDYPVGYQVLCWNHNIKRHYISLKEQHVRRYGGD